MFGFLKSLFSSTPVNPALLGEAIKQVDSLITENTVMVFSKSYCPYCTSAKSILSQAGIQFKSIELDQIGNGSTVQAALAERAGLGRVTVPQIYIKNKLIGGCSDLQRLSKAKLNELLA